MSTYPAAQVPRQNAADVLLSFSRVVQGPKGQGGAEAIVAMQATFISASEWLHQAAKQKGVQMTGTYMGMWQDLATHHRRVFQ